MGLYVLGGRAAGSVVPTEATAGMETRCRRGPEGEAELRSPPASTCARALGQSCRNKGALVSSTMPPFWPGHLPPGLEAAPGGSEGPFCAGMNGSLFPSGGLPPPACRALTLPTPSPTHPPGRLGLLCLPPEGSGHPEMGNLYLCPQLLDKGSEHVPAGPMVKGGPADPTSIQIPVTSSFFSVETKCMLPTWPACGSPIPLGKGGMVERAREVTAEFTSEAAS